MKFGCSVSKCYEKLNDGDSRKTLRESHGGLSGKGSQTLPSHQPPARHSVPVVRALQKGGLPPPYNLWIESYRYKEGEEEGARGSKREREGVRGGARTTLDSAGVFHHFGVFQTRMRIATFFIASRNRRV